MPVVAVLITLVITETCDVWRRKEQRAREDRDWRRGQRQQLYQDYVVALRELHELSNDVHASVIDFQAARSAGWRDTAPQAERLNTANALRRTAQAKHDGLLDRMKIAAPVRTVGLAVEARGGRPEGPARLRVPRPVGVGGTDAPGP